MPQMKGWEPEWFNPQTIILPLFEPENGLKCVSGQGGNSVNQKNLMFPTRVYPTF